MGSMSGSQLIAVLGIGAVAVIVAVGLALVLLKMSQNSD